MKLIMQMKDGCVIEYSNLNLFQILNFQDYVNHNNTEVDAYTIT